MDQMRVQRVRLRAWRRGFREADLILGPFADKHAQNFDDAEMTCFEALLQAPDLDVYAWILKSEPTPPEFETPLMERLRAFVLEAGGH
jgi:antitoxin CptB